MIFLPATNETTPVQMWEAPSSPANRRLASLSGNTVGRLIAGEDGAIFQSRIELGLEDVEMSLPENWVVVAKERFINFEESAQLATAQERQFRGLREPVQRSQAVWLPCCAHHGGQRKNII